MSLEEKIERMMILKDHGNSYFKQGDLGRAFAHYEKSVKWIQVKKPRENNNDESESDSSDDESDVEMNEEEVSTDGS